MKLFRNLLLVMGSCLAMTACQRNVDYYADNNAATASDFTFSTSQNVKLNVTYNMQVAVPFSVYSENPVVTTTTTDGNFTSTLKDGVEPLYTGYTSNKGTFSNTITLPSYATKLYIVSSSLYVQDVLEAAVNGGVATAVEPAETTSSSVASRSANSTSTLLKFSNQTDMENWYTPLGTFDKSTGLIDYALTKTAANANLFFDDDLVSGFYTSITTALDVHKECPIEYLSSHDLTVDENKQISITMLGGNTCWNSTMGYYYYSGATPTKASDLHIITLFPNTQDGKVTNSSFKAVKPVGVVRGTVVQLKYYGKNYDEAASDVFPAGTKIGFVLSSNAWGSNTLPGKNKSNNFFSFTTPDLSSNNVYTRNPYKNNSDRVPYKKINTAFMNSNGATLVCFEDHSDDHNCTDVTFALKPAFPNVIELGSKTIKSATNTYAFEDLWPAVGDYDMNDVVVYDDYAKEMQGYNNNSYYITKEQFAFTTDQNHSNRTDLNDGLAVWLKGSYANAKVEFKAASSDTYTTYTDYTTAEENGKTYFYLTKNVKTNMGGTYRITITHEYTSQVANQTASGCFLWRDDTVGRWEVHIPYEEPTSKLCATYKNKLVSGKPYAAITSDGNVFYPFGLCLIGANANNIAKLLNASNETVRIDKLYSGYAAWFKSAGTTNTDWYIGE